ncbi:helix-turn-helix domain-containing protein [Moraxella boevrei]|uniref:helix-turn-helix domain-containing protein n=1 Tax=Faucicola boevrei TaxID=346665 RepID=UPI003735E9A8
MKIQEKIRFLRQQKNLTQEQVAELLDLTPQAYSKIEQGKTRLNIERIQQIANIFNIDITDLINNDSNSIVLLLNGDFNSDNGSTNKAIIYNNTTTELVNENEKLLLQLQFKDKIIKRLEDEVATLKLILTSINQTTDKK